MSHPHTRPQHRKRLVLALVATTSLAVAAATMSWSPAAGTPASTSAAAHAQASAPAAASQQLSPLNRRIRDSRVDESSGLAHSTYQRRTLFTHNDSGDQPRVFAVSRHGRTLAVLKLEGARAYDWEDMASGPDNTLWVGDIGDNPRSRKQIHVYRFKEPKTLRNRTVRSTKFTFAYPDGAHDAEGLMVNPRTGRVFVVSKQDKGVVYRAPKHLSSSKVNRLRKVRGAPAKVTSAAFRPNGKGYVLGTYGSAHLYKSLRSGARKISVPSRQQGESIDFNRTGKRLFAGSEGRTSPVFQVAVGRSTSSTRSCAKAPAYKKAGTRFGTSLSTSKQSLAESVRSVDSKFGHVPVVRTFDPTIPPDQAWSRRAPVLGDNRMIVTSFREHPNEILSGKFDAKIRAYFREAPDNTILYSYFHEADAEVAKEKSFTPARFRAAFRHVVDIASSLCRDNLYPTLILTGWTASKASGREWQDYYPGNSYVSVMSWDPYNSANSKPTTYADPSTLYADVVRESKAIGKPWGIAETGSARIDGDASGVQRGAWLKKVCSYFDNKGAAYVTYFQSTRDQDFELRDKPSIDAWKGCIRGS